MNTVKKPCTCKHPQQDEMHGKQVRVHNRTTKPGARGWRCTVCKAIKPE